MSLSARMKQRLFTIGYERQSIDTYIDELLAAGVDVIVDVRETAWSYKRDFSSRPLERALAIAGIRYYHASFAGNPKEFRSQAESHADCLSAFENYLASSSHVVEMLDALLQDLFDDGATVCLTCYERHPGDCHRAILAQAWANMRKATVYHLAASGLPRRAPGYPVAGEVF